jgi:hypothetical protein
VEEYGLDELAASAESVVAGLGPLAAGLARLADQACRAVTLDAMEVLVAERGRELLRGVVQLGLDRQAAAEVRVAEVTGADGVRRGRAERDHARTVVTSLGEVVVRRIAYRAGVKGVPSLFPRDAVLNLPAMGFSWPLQRLAEMSCRSGSYGQAQELVLAATGVLVGKRQLEQITVRAAGDAEQFCQDKEPAGLEPARDGKDGLAPLAISADGKGVAMRPEARRPTRYRPVPGAFGKRLSTGEKRGVKRMAETGCVFDVEIPDGPDGPARTPGQVMGASGKDKPAAPRAVNRWYITDITSSRDVTIARVFDQAERRDPGHRRTWIALVDGDNSQIGQIQAQAARRGITIIILIDFIHVLEYLWKTAWCFHQPRDPAIEDWVTAQALDILHGRAGDVTARIRQLASDHPPQGSEHAKIISRTLSYLTAKQPYLACYPRALAEGWPIATGVIEGACRHLVADRMAITGARWSLPGAQAILWLRAIHASGDHDTYWNYHIRQEHQRNHVNRYAAGTLALAA